MDVNPTSGRTTGAETVTFRPDRAVDRLVFRLWLNSPRPAGGGGWITLRSAAVDGRAVSPRYQSAGAGAGTRGTLVELPLGRTVAAGTSVVAHVTFELQLPSDVNDRWGHSGGTAWLGSALPMLAWESGRGWAREPATSAFAEASTSEVFRLAQLVVDAPSGNQVLATGIRRGVQQLASGKSRHVFDAAAVRDALVTVGRFRMHADSSAGVRVTAAVSPGLADDAGRVAGLNSSAIRAHAARWGRFPYDDLDVIVVPDISGGIEYPGAILLGTGQDRDATLSHEVAHEWFYGLAGNNQGRDPWLDESFATYAEALHRGTGSKYLATRIPADGRNRVGAPMTYWEQHRASYYRSVYVQGAAALLRARSASGAARFDAAIRCYVDAASHRVAVPADLERMLAHLPAAVRELRRAGALP